MNDPVHHYRVTDLGLLDVYVFTDLGALCRHIFQRSMEQQGEAWWDDYEERRDVSNRLLAAWA
jgi:hypothetical protein